MKPTKKTVRKKVVNPTMEQIAEFLDEIKWSLRPHGCEHYYLYNHKKKCTGLYLLFPRTDARLCFEGKDYNTPSYYFYLKDVVMDMLENCVSFRGRRDKTIFILCSNYDIKKPSLSNPKKK